MSKFFECKLRYEKQITDTNDKDCGKLKRVNETYLVNAINCTDAEARLIKEVVTPYVKSESAIPSIKEVSIAETINDDSDAQNVFFYVRVKLIVVDENTGNEKFATENVLVKAGDISDALSLQRSFQRLYV